MGMQTGSVLIRRQLGRRLQALRIEAGRTHEDIARARIASRSTISKIENGKGVTKIGTLMELARFYRADHETTEALIALGEGARMDGWWEESAAAWPEWLGEWVKASVSSANGSCVEMRRHAGAVEVRDTKQHGQGPTLGLTRAQFAAWLAAAKSGEFDELA